MASEEEQPSGITPIDDLQKFGIGSSDLKKLKDVGILTVETLAHSAKKDLLTVKGLSEVKVEKLLKEAYKLVPMGFATASSLFAMEKDRVHITTGCKEFDTILDGGIESCSLTEIYGEYRCGKTQLSHTLCVTCQLAIEQGGGEGRALYIDTEGTFRPQRLASIARRFNMDVDEVLQNVAVAKAHNTDQQMDLLMMAASLMIDSHFSLVIVDSATALYRTEFNGRGELSVRQVHLGRFLRQLQKLADEFGVAVVVTNQVVAANLDGGSMFAGPNIKAIGGNIMAHSTTTRIWVKKGRKENRIARIVSSPSLPEREATFAISEGGVIDAED
eukprot:TRINITY_DN16984_c0_g2_i2.p1 TRINITY_DN16984_c0_g2~~TRINITY_DN16984_c0_g2_i2.p1  ORF type:complete len:330 (+),score=48.75 TRINITY_DN16984_c0_g2_i2:340-1329(+)